MAEGNKKTLLQVSGFVHEWPVKETDCFLQKGSIFSSTVCAYNASWRFEYNPSGKAIAYENYSSLYVHKLAERYPFTPPLRLSLSIEVGNNVVVTKVLKNAFGENFIGSCGFLNFCKRSELMKHLRPVNDSSVTSTMLDPSTSNDTITIRCSFCVLGNERKNTATQATSLSKGLVIREKNFEDIYHSGKHSDVKIKIGSNIYSLHMTMLVSQSPFFSSKFENWMAVNVDGVMDLTDDIDCCTDAFELVTKFMYTGNLGNVSVRNIINVFIIAVKLGMVGLQEICCNVLSENLDVQSVSGVLDLAVTHKETDLLGTAIRFFILNATKVFDSANWRKLVNEKPSVTEEVLQMFSARSVISLKNENS